MNLSSYLQMPPAPPVPQSPSTSATQGLAAGVRADAGSTAGQDFANIMARQFQRLSASERPSFAAVASPKPEVSAQDHQTHRAQWTNNQSFAAKQRLKDDAQTDHAVATSKNSAEKNDAEKNTQEKRAEQRAQQLRDGASAEALKAADATLLAQVAMMAMPATTPMQGSTPMPAEALPTLRTFALSPQVNIITTPSATPNAESLTEFAKSMGLDEAAIQKLMGQGMPAANAPLSTPNGNAVSANGADPLMQALNAAVAGTPDGSGGLTNALPSTTQASPAATQLAALGLLPGSSADNTATLTPTQPQAMTLATQLPANANLLGMAAQAPAQAGLSTAEMASIQNVQMTLTAPVAPPVASMQNMTLSANGSVKTTSTLDALSLLGGNVTEQSIQDLVAQFSQNAAGDDAQQQSSSGNGSGQGFAQALAQTTGSVPAGRDNASAQVATTTPMSEVYDQLSDKMATEMAARMHKQLSDGEWKMKFGLRPAHLGGVEIQLEMKDGKLNAVIHAENPLTRDLLQNSSQRLREALENFGIHAGQMHIGQDSANAQQNPSRDSSKPSQVGDNSSLQVKDSDQVASATETRNKANASLLDLYA